MHPAFVGLAGPTLTADERALFAAHPPAGAILFRRNIEDPAQLARLTATLREVLAPEAGLMVDQEGGRVARLRAPHWPEMPAARAVGGRGARAAWLHGALIGAMCRAAGFTVVAAPCLDVGGLHEVIGDRAFSDDPERVAALGGAMAEGLLAAGVEPIGKHAPGHGRARADSHLALPELDDIAAADLLPFRRNAWLPWLMTAHIRYRARDAVPATLSAPIIGGVIRGREGIGFDGVLSSDDLAMGALQGRAGERARAALGAGCDIALHCSGVFAETRDVLESLAPIGEATRARLDAARGMAAARAQTLDIAALRAEYAALLGAA